MDSFKSKHLVNLMIQKDQIKSNKSLKIIQKQLITSINKSLNNDLLLL